MRIANVTKAKGGKKWTPTALKGTPSAQFEKKMHFDLAIVHNLIMRGKHVLAEMSVFNARLNLMTIGLKHVNQQFHYGDSRARKI